MCLKKEVIKLLRSNTTVNNRSTFGVVEMLGSISVLFAHRVHAGMMTLATDYNHELGQWQFLIVILARTYRLDGGDLFPQYGCKLTFGYT